MNQLALSLKLRDECRLSNFVFFEGHRVLKAELDGANSLWLAGPLGSGRTHLLCAMAELQGANALYLDAAEIVSSDPSGILDGLEHHPCLLFDDIDILVSERSWAEALFHLYNRQQAMGGRWICSAQSAPRNTEFALADFQSRMMAQSVFEMPLYSDEERAVIFLERAKRRGLNVSSEVVPYLNAHLPRSLVFWLSLLDLLDSASLVERRRVSVPLLKQVLAQNPAFSAQQILC